MTRSQLVQCLRKRNPVVWCGAGISVPSGLPTASELLHFLLSNLRIQKIDVQRLAVSRLPFELMIELLTPTLRVRRFAESFKLGEPNTNHLLLAKLIKQGLVNTICTTNFDLLIERALSHEGLKPSRDYAIYSSPEEFQQIDWASRQPRLIKLHGTADRPETIITTLARVAARGFSAEQANVITNVFSSGPHDDVLVLGYSFSDSFDITPQIRAITRAYKTLIAVQHSSNSRAARNSHLALRLQNELGLPEGKIIALSLDTNALVHTLWTSLAFGSTPPAPSRAHWKRTFRTVFQRVSRAKLLRTAAQIFETSGDLPRSVEYYENALATARSMPAFRGQLICDVGRVSNSSGNFHKAIQYAEASLEIARARRNRRAQAANLSNMAIAHHNLANYEESIKYNLKAVALAQTVGATRIEGGSLANLGLTYRVLGKYATAARYHERAIKLAQIISDKNMEARQLGNLGVCYRYLHRLDDCERCYEQSLSLARLLGNRIAEAVTLGEIGNLQKLRGKADIALRYYRRAYSLAAVSGNRREQWNSLNNIAETLSELGRKNAAIKYAKNALRIAEDTESSFGEATTLITLGTIELTRGHQREAKVYAQRALSITGRMFPARHKLHRAASKLCSVLSNTRSSCGLDR